MHGYNPAVPRKHEDTNDDFNMSYGMETREMAQIKYSILRLDSPIEILRFLAIQKPYNYERFDSDRFLPRKNGTRVCFQESKTDLISKTAV